MVRVADLPPTEDPSAGCMDRIASKSLPGGATSMLRPEMSMQFRFLPGNVAQMSRN